MVTSLVLPLLGSLMLFLGSASAQDMPGGIPSEEMEGGMPKIPTHIKPCCSCGQCKATCNCSCGCSIVDPDLMCLQKYDSSRRVATFKDEHGKTIEVPVVNPDKFSRVKPGECGKATIKMDQVCTDFTPQQKGSSRKMDSDPQQKGISSQEAQ